MSIAGWVGEGDSVSGVTRLLSRARKLNPANATVVLRRPEFRGTNAWRRRSAQNQILSEFPSGLNQTGGKFCLILGVGVSLGRVLIEQTGGGAGCLVAMLEARLDESGVFILREKIKSWHRVPEPYLRSQNRVNWGVNWG